ncbi:hypothetical protein BJA01nite_55250 [Bradyrhizobium japonicum]|nr:hypothetical protein BJ6T_16000 [Bradyrhizobium japonicum USDA 6]GEC47883.1 hypothetical protein BJA01nite_55250 [Bradyrhizobium japonicum]
MRVFDAPLRCFAEPGPTLPWAPALQRITPDDASHRRECCAASGARERRQAIIAFNAVAAEA